MEKTIEKINLILKNCSRAWLSYSIDHKIYVLWIYWLDDTCNTPLKVFRTKKDFSDYIKALLVIWKNPQRLKDLLINEYFNK